jgi:hypothetical protein
MLGDIRVRSVNYRQRLEHFFYGMDIVIYQGELELDPVPD